MAESKKVLEQQLTSALATQELLEQEKYKLELRVKFLRKKLRKEELAFMKLVIFIEEKKLLPEFEEWVMEAFTDQDQQKPLPSDR